MSNLDVVILAAGKGTRMQSKLPKVMHHLGGKPLISHVIERARDLNPNAIYVIYGDKDFSSRHQIDSPDLDFIEQTKQLGTAHAVIQTIPKLSSRHTLILYGDVPLLKKDTLLRLLDSNSPLSVLSTELHSPKGYGRLIRNQSGQIRKIVEEADASEEEKLISEVNTGIIFAQTKLLKTWLPKIENNNAQREYYLTDLVAIAVAENQNVQGVLAGSHTEVMGINTKAQLAQAERVLQAERANELLVQGVTIADPTRIDIRGNLNCADDVFIDINCIFEGTVNLSTGVSIGAHSIICDSDVGEGTQILPYTQIDNAKIGRNCRIGPYSRLRTGTSLGENVKIGNFVETKKTTLGSRTSANHLSYLGDSEVGEDVNIGAGTITCNYDGKDKHKTIIEDKSFIGSNSSLVAPVRVGSNSVVGAGSTITKNTEADKLTVGRSKQITVAKWKRPIKKT